MSFDEWFDNQGIENWTNKKYMFRAYEAGAASRQKEVEQLQKQVDELKDISDQLLIENIYYRGKKWDNNESYSEGQASMYNIKQKQIDELQKRIDEALNKLLYMHHYGNDVSIVDVIEILKGESNDGY